MKNKSKKGFTLVEIMIVVVIIGLLAALAIPAFTTVRERTIKSTLDNDARQLASAANQYFLEQNVSTAKYDDLVGDGLYLKSLSKGVEKPASLTANGTFVLKHPNYNSGADVTYNVDDGKEVTTGGGTTGTTGTTGSGG